MALTRAYDRSADHGANHEHAMLIRDAENEYDRRRYMYHHYRTHPKARS